MNPNYILENDFYKVNKCAHPAITMRNHTNLNWNNKLEYAIFLVYSLVDNIAVT